MHLSTLQISRKCIKILISFFEKLLFKIKHVKVTFIKLIAIKLSLWIDGLRTVNRVMGNNERNYREPYFASGIGPR